MIISAALGGPGRRMESSNIHYVV
jgi:hypothetical protein